MTGYGSSVDDLAGMAGNKSDEEGIPHAIEYTEKPESEVTPGLQANEALEEQLEDLQVELDERMAADVEDGRQPALEERSLALSDETHGYGFYAVEGFEEEEGEDQDDDDEDDDEYE